jgi:hypothetical protein
MRFPARDKSRRIRAGRFDNTSKADKSKRFRFAGDSTLHSPRRTGSTALLLICPGTCVKRDVRVD